jgi:hypothetical protein
MKTNKGANQNAITAAMKACATCGQELTAGIERVKRNLLREFQETLAVPERLFRLALNEAEALAWQTEYPHLLFPTLATEKVQAIAGWNARQQFIRRKNSDDAMSN